ncbi:hypothetical protein ACH4ZU_32155 [Streptomyces sp. NPDC020472]
MPTESPPPGHRARTAKAARAQSVTDGVKDGARASRSSDEAKAASSKGAR